MYACVRVCTYICEVSEHKVSSCPTPHLSSPQTVGVIVRLEKEEFKVLTQHGKVRVTIRLGRRILVVGV